ncbi:MAG: PTS sugar transporter subunit IIA [Planctomycetota bacterium]|jgi:PTS system fructose-specific IIA component
MKLSEYLPEASIKIPLESRTKEGIVRELIDLLPLLGGVEEKEAIFRSVMAREKEMSTGVGNGIALPHGTVPIEKIVVASMGILEDPIEFGAIDGEPVRLVFLIVADDSHPSHNLEALASVARALHDADFREALAESKSPAEVREAILAQERGASS